MGVASELLFDLLAEHVGDVEGERALMVVESDEGDDEFDDNELFSVMGDA